MSPCASVASAMTYVGEETNDSDNTEELAGLWVCPGQQRSECKGRELIHHDHADRPVSRYHLVGHESLADACCSCSVIFGRPRIWSSTRRT